MTWEYKIVYFGLDTLDEDDYEERLHERGHMLNELGSQGWELITLVSHRTADRLKKYHAVLKRPATG